MARIVGVQGFPEQVRGGYQLASVWYNALRDGLEAAGMRHMAAALAPADVRVVFFSDLFRLTGSVAVDEALFSAADLQPGPEWDLLDELYRAAVAQDPTVGGPQGAIPEGKATAQVMVSRLARSATFARVAQRALIGNLKQLAAFFTDPTVKQNALARLREQVGADTRVVIGHSLGSVVAYEYLCHDQPGSVQSLVTLGSPLGIPRVVFDRLSPPPVKGVGVWPARVATWVNVADPDDLIALRKDLAPLFSPTTPGQAIVDRLVDNGDRPHAIERYLNKRETGSALGDALGAQAGQRARSVAIPAQADVSGLGGLRLRLQAGGADLAGTPVVIDVIDRNFRLVSQQALTVGGEQDFVLRPGNYGLRVLLPSGQVHTDTATVGQGTASVQAMDLFDGPLHSWLKRTTLLKSSLLGKHGNLDHSLYDSVWLRLWTRSEGVWNEGRWRSLEAIQEPDAVRFRIHSRAQQQMLQIGGPHIPWRMLSMPAAEQLEVTVRPSGDEAAPQLAVTVATGDNQVEALLGYLTIGALNHAGLVEQQAEALLSDTSGSAAAVAGFYLLRVSNLEGLRNWPANVANLTGWMSDGAIIQAWKLLREQQEARTRSQSLLPTARALLLGAVERGTPVYMEGLRLLVMGLKLIDFATNGQDGEVRDALGHIRPYVQAAYLGQPTFIYGGSSPLSPSVSPVYGVPRLHGNLVFLWNQKVTGKEAGIFLGRSSSEGKTSRSQSPAQKAEPRRSQVRRQKVVVTIVCDFPHDGDVDATETVSFAFEGTSYEIDLCSAHAREFREAFSQYIKHARRVRPVSHRRRARAGPGRERSAEIRAWAKQRGHKVSERGRIPAAIITEHESTH